MNINEQEQHILLAEGILSTSRVRRMCYNLKENTHYFNVHC